MFRRFALCFVVLPAWLAVAGCGGGGGTSQPVEVVFTHSVMDLGDFAYIQPLGNLNPPGHTFPTDHVGFYFTNPQQTYPVYAPAAGTIVGILNRSQAGPPVIYDHKLEISHGGTVRSYVDHVGQLDPALTARLGNLPQGYSFVSIPVAAGQRIGSAGGRADTLAMDLGTYDTALTLEGFIHPDRYPTQTAHCTAPLSYYRDDLRAALYSYVRRTGADKDGKIDFDVPGKLVGNWFAEGATHTDWTRHLSFVYDPNEPTEVRIALGGELGITGAYQIPPTAPRPETVGQPSGKVTYPLWLNGWQMGLLIVQVTGPEEIRVQAFPGSTATEANFTAEARTYTR